MIPYDFTRYLPSQNLNLSVWRFREILVTLKCQILPKNAFDPIVVINVKSDITYNVSPTFHILSPFSRRRPTDKRKS